jgi:uncharacterized protein YegP (UPF0339 family)
MSTQHQADFILLQSKDDQTYFTLRAANHEVVLTSEMYTSLSAAKNGIEAVRTAAQLDDNFVRKSSHDGQPYFVLRAANHEIIGVSQMYSSPAKRDEGVLACQRAAAEARLVDGR